MGIGELSSKCFIIDMGLAKRYREARTHEHIKYREGLNLTGTARYASINALSGCEQSRRDDIESWAYTLIYLLKYLWIIEGDIQILLAVCLFAWLFVFVFVLFCFYDIDLYCYLLTLFS